MSEHEERFENIRGHVKDAHDELHALDEEARQPYKAELERLDKVIAYAALVLDGTDPELISVNVHTAVEAAASAISDNPLTALQTAEAYGNALLDAVAQLPAARDRDIEQQVKDAAANFQRAASNRLNTLKSEFDTAREELAALSAAITKGKADVGTEIDAQTTEFAAKLTELEGTITTQRLALDDLMTQQSKAFTTSQEENATAFNEATEQFEKRLAAIHQQAQDEVDERVAEIRRMEKESSQLVGAIGLAGTAERYSVEAKEQRKAANWFVFLAGLVAVLAVVAAARASFDEDQSNQVLIGKLTVSFILAGLSAYFARQAGRHRRREEYARSLQLDLTAFSPFIEPLSPEQQEEERVIMTRKTFGKTSPSSSSDDDSGPAPTSFLMQRRKKQLEAGEDDTA
jgi:hypothetical protein